MTIPLLDTSKVTNMSNMFYNCSSLKTFPSLDTSKVTSMSSMFNSCSSLTTIPSLDTSNVTSMLNMFRHCSSLTTIPSLNISSVASMGSMFDGCGALTSVTFQCNDVRPYGIGMFNATPIASGNGRIYVPDNLVQAYKTASGWSTHASVIYGHSDKPWRLINGKTFWRGIAPCFFIGPIKWVLLIQVIVLTGVGLECYASVTNRGIRVNFFWGGFFEDMEISI